MEAEVAVSAEMGLTSDTFEKGITSLKKHFPRDPSIRKAIPRSGIMPTSGPLLLNFGSSPAGALWVPMYVTVSGPDDHTAVASGQYAVYFGGRGDTSPGLANLLVPATTNTAIPNWTVLSNKNALYGYFGDEFFILVYGATTGTIINAVARIREVHPASAEQARYL